MSDYRVHDAPDQDRPREILSPYAKAALGCAYALPFLGFATRGLWGLAGAAGTVGIIATSAPAWTRNSFIERHESTWIIRKLERYYVKEKRKADEEERLKIAFENPTRHEIAVRDAGCLLCVLLVLAMIALGITRVPSGGIYSNLWLTAFLVCLYPALNRFSRFRRLQYLADEPRGGVKTRTLRDFAVYVEGWPNRYPLFLISSLLAAVAAVMLALSRKGAGSRFAGRSTTSWPACRPGPVQASL